MPPSVEALLTNAIQGIGWTFDIAGVLFMVVGVLIATAVATRGLLKKPATHQLFRTYRQNLARSVLIGLELLVVGDIIRTVAGDLTLEGVGVLAGIVAIRVVLGVSLEAEISGQWPRFRHALRRPRRQV